jgi:hypothetical protein
MFINVLGVCAYFKPYSINKVNIWLSYICTVVLYNFVYCR